MGVFTRPDSPYFWLWLETAPPGFQREKTAIKVGGTEAQKRDAKRHAEDVYHKRMQEIAARIHKLPTARPSIRFSDYAQTYKTDVIANRRGSEREYGLLKPLIAAFGPLPLQAIDQDRVNAWMTARRKVVSARTVNREQDLLKSMLRDAVPKYVEVSPLVGMKRLAIIKPKRRLLTEAEERRLLKHAASDPVAYALIVNALDSLIRLQDLLDLTRADRRGRFIYLADPKNGEAQEVALSTRGAAALDAIPGDKPHWFAKFRTAKHERDRRGRVRRMLKKFCKHARIPYGQKKGGLTFHWATRRTGATRMLVDRRVPLPVVQRQGGWKDPTVLLQIYAEAGKRDLLKAVDPLPKRSRSKRKTA